MNPIVAFALGMAGALAPEVIRLYSIRQNPKNFRWSWFYVAVSLLFAGLGGVLALALPATTYWGALYVGVSTPVLITTIARKGHEVARPELRGAAPPPRSGWPAYVYGL
ncbi:hypothetical protein AB0E59_17650 [Lentzea sp. NPDC034063]|uniref:hypothetical protein n=1 Tax=unclassified Lentzea TaxID=2643253 RepID=UPI0033F1F0B9